MEGAGPGAPRMRFVFAARQESGPPCRTLKP